jgi:hypothetical protein
MIAFTASGAIWLLEVSLRRLREGRDPPGTQLAPAGLGERPVSGRLGKERLEVGARLR